MPWIVEAVRGEGRIGLEGFVSELKVLMSDNASGTGGALIRLANVVPPAPDRRDRMLLLLSGFMSTRRSELAIAGWETPAFSVASFYGTRI